MYDLCLSQNLNPLELYLDLFVRDRSRDALSRGAIETAQIFTFSIHDEKWKRQLYLLSWWELPLLWMVVAVVVDDDGEKKNPVAAGQLCHDVEAVDMPMNE